MTAAQPQGRTAAGTVGAALAEAVVIMHGADVEDVRREADEIYAALVLGATSRAFLDREEPIAPALRERLLEAARRRAGGMPQAYATGRANFRGHWLAVDERVLIPRHETEGLVDEVIAWAAARRSRDPAARLPLVADIGTGSGAIAIAVALEAPVAGVIATDISAEALTVALANAATTGARDRVAFRRGSLLEPLLGEVMEAIVCNLPYVATPEVAVLHPTVRNYEPRVALDGGADGLELFRQFLAQAPPALAPLGLLALETDAGRADATAALVQQTGSFEHVEVRHDLFGRPRYVIARRTERG